MALSICFGMFFLKSFSSIYIDEFNKTLDALCMWVSFCLFKGLISVVDFTFDFVCLFVVAVFGRVIIVLFFR